MKKTHAAVFLFLAIFGTCVKRDDGIHEQDNPFDSGGNNWTKNQPPKIINHSSPIPRWVDFYFPDSTGSIQLSFTASDPDGKAQLLTVSVYLSTDNGNFIQQALDTSLQSDSTIRVRGIVPNKNYLYKIIVRDSTLDPNKAKLIKSASDTAEGSFVSPDGIPPHPPQRITVDNKAYVITLKWDSAYTDSLVIFRSRSNTGPYVPVATITAQSFPDVQTITGLYYYRAGALNKHGMAWYKDTLTGLIYNSTLTTLPSVSWDETPYEDSIGLTWTKPFISNYTVDGFSLYRAKHPAGPYSKIADTNALQYSYRFVDRNIKKTDNFYYRLTYTTKIGVSNFSPYVVAHIARLTAPGKVIPSAGTCGKYIRVQWDSVPGAPGYLLYRHLYYQVSDTVFLDSVSGTAYNDTVTIDTLYRYFVAAYNAKGRGDYSTDYTAGYLMKKPSAVQWDTANTTHKYIYIKWYYETMKFRLYRSTDSVTFTLLDTARTGYNNYLDSSAAPGTFYYYHLTKIIDSTSQESRPSAIVRGMLRPVPPGDSLFVKSSLDIITLYWNTIPAAYYYKLYRTFNKYATARSQYSFFSATEDTSYAITDSTIDTTMYYKITAVNACGFENPWNVKNTYGWPVKKDTANCPRPVFTAGKESW